MKRSHDAQAKLKGEKSSRDKDSEMSKRSSNLVVVVNKLNGRTHEMGFLNNCSPNVG